MADIQRVRTRLSDDTTITYGGVVNVVQISGCIDDFISVVRGTHDFVVCVSSSASMRMCGLPDPGWEINPGLSFPEFGSGGLCPTDQKTKSWAYDGFGGVGTSSMTFRQIGPMTLTVDSGSSTMSFDPVGPTYAPNTAVEVTPIPGPGLAFSSWTVVDPFLGPLADSFENPLNLIMDRNWNLTANFIRLASGSVSTNPASRSRRRR